MIYWVIHYPNEVIKDYLLGWTAQERLANLSRHLLQASSKAEKVPKSYGAIRKPRYQRV
jgi:hypothetical protein